MTRFNSKELYSSEVDHISSVISAKKQLREKLINYQRKFPEQYGDNKKFVIIEGRDIGTVVFPNADYKFFITANDKSRAERRLMDLVSVGDKKVSELDVVLDELRVRDRKDSTRDLSPLQKADDAIIIDTTYLAIDEVVKKIVNIVNHKRTLI